jgi:hypothetical protein
MFTFILNLFGKGDHLDKKGPPTTISTGTDINKMSLDDRRVWRQEMAHKSLRETFTVLGVKNDMYKYKLSRLDDRGHHYSLMIEVTKDFCVSTNVSIDGFGGIEKKINIDAFNKYGIAIDDVFWKTNENTNMFERDLAGIRHINTIDLLKKQAVKDKFEEEFEDTAILEYKPDSRSITRPKYGPTPEQEVEAFRQALKAKKQPPPMKVGNQEYFTDLMPFDPDQ